MENDRSDFENEFREMYYMIEKVYLGELKTDTLGLILEDIRRMYIENF